MSFDFNSLKTQKQWKEFIINLIQNNDEALKRAIVAIYRNQTFEEQVTYSCIYEDNAGFSKIDVKEMSMIAGKILSGMEPLTEGEKCKSRNKIIKYWKQLMMISKDNIAKKEYLKELKERRSKKDGQDIDNKYDNGCTHDISYRERFGGFIQEI